MKAAILPVLVLLIALALPVLLIVPVKLLLILVIFPELNKAALSPEEVICPEFDSAPIVPLSELAMA